MPRSGVPSSARWLIGVELARHRNVAGLTLAEASRLSGIPKPSIGHLESGRMQQDIEQIFRLLSGYETDWVEIDRLTALAGRADEAAWWAPWARVVPDWFSTFVGLEALAIDEFVYEPTLVPELLQTPAYARELTESSPLVPPAYRERHVDLRMARAARLDEVSAPLGLHAVIADAALRLVIGTPELHRDQLRHLLRMSEQDNVVIQIVRPEDGHHAAAHGRVTILGLGEAPSLAYLEVPHGAVYLADPEDVEAYMLVAESLQRVALAPKESSALLSSMIRG